VAATGAKADPAGNALTAAVGGGKGGKDIVIDAETVQQILER
jgi:hypothetical protein